MTCRKIRQLRVARRRDACPLSAPGLNGRLRAARARLQNSESVAQRLAMSMPDIVALVIFIALWIGYSWITDRAKLFDRVSLTRAMS